MLCQLGDMHMKRHCSGGMEERARKSAIQSEIKMKLSRRNVTSKSINYLWHSQEALRVQLESPGKGKFELFKTLEQKLSQ